MHLTSLWRAIRNKNRQLKRLRAKMQQVLNEGSIQVDEELTSDIQKVIVQHKAVVEKDDSRRIFWEQQVCSALGYYMCNCQYT